MLSDIDPDVDARVSGYQVTGVEMGAEGEILIDLALMGGETRGMLLAAGRRPVRGSGPQALIQG